MNGMVLAAGHGTRMEPLSTHIPKPALEVLGRPLVASVLAHLRRTGCQRTVVNLHRHPEFVAAAVRSAEPGAVFSWEPELLGGAGGLAAARNLLGEGTVLAANADVWADLDLAPLLAAGGRDTVTLALLPHPDPVRWSAVVLDADGRVRDLLPPGARHRGESYVFTGFQLVGADVMAALPMPPAEMHTTWEALRCRGALRGVEVAGQWCEVGTPDAYLGLIARLLGGNVWIHPQAEVSAGARTASSAVGAGCRVAGEALVEGSVVTGGAVIAEGAAVHHCVAAGSVTVTGAHSREVILPAGSFPLP